MLLTGLVIAWITGLLLGLEADMPVVVLALWGLGIATLGATVFSLRRYRRPFTLGCIALALVLTGAWLGEQASDEAVAADLAPLFDQKTVDIRGLVVSDPERIGSSYRFKLGELETKGSGAWEEINGAILVTARPDGALSAQRAAPHFRYGDVLVLDGSVEDPPVFEDFDYRDYLARQGVGALMSFPSTTTLEDTGEGSWFREQVFTLRTKLSASLGRSLPEPQAALAQSLILGKRKDLPEDVRQDFIDTGTSHLLAISGLHIAIMLGAMLAFGRLLFGGGRWALVFALGGIWLYALLSGMSPSVTRAVIMGSVYLFGRFMGREGASLPALAAAAAVMAGLNPNVLSNVSFQLSFSAVAALLLLAPRLERRFTAVVERYAGTEGPAFTFGRALSVALATGAAATVGTLPLVILVFERVSYLGIPVTLLALPALPFALVGGAGTAIAGLVWEPLGVLVGGATWVPLAYLLEMVGGFSSVLGGSFHLGGVTPLLVWLYYGIALALLGGPRLYTWLGNAAKLAYSIVVGRPGFVLPRFKLAALSLLIVSAVLWTAAITSPDGRLTVVFLDVGQGDAVFIRTPSGQQVLVDGGPDPQVTLVALGDVMPFWDRSLDAVVLTHPHADHLEGLMRVMELYDVDMVADSGLVSGTPLYLAWRKLLTDEGVERSVLYGGQQLRTGDGVVIDVLNPPAEQPKWTPDILNNGSLVLRVSYGEVSFLLTGDIQHEAEEQLVANGGSLRSTVYKAPHHGSDTSSTAAFLGAVDPSIAVISVGVDNRFGHPDEGVVARLEDAVSPGNVFLTSEHGDVQFTTDGEKLWVDARTSP